MTSYAITVGAIEHYAEACEQFEHLLGRLAGAQATVRWRPSCKRKATSCCAV